jgi:hypothetical protein
MVTALGAQAPQSIDGKQGLSTLTTKFFGGMVCPIPCPTIYLGWKNSDPVLFAGM